MMCWWNRLRGTYSIFAKVNAVFLGLLFWYFIDNYYIGFAVAIGYLAGESMGWGEWIGGLIRILRKEPPPEFPSRESSYTGIQWIATKFTEIDSFSYHFLALTIRGFYWWGLTLLPLFFVIEAPVWLCIAILFLSIGFPTSIVVSRGETGTEHWKNAEYVYGGMQDFAILFIILFLI